MSITEQLNLLGLEETRRRAAADAVTPKQRERLLRRVEAAHELLSTLPEAEDLSFLHSGLCQTALPHSRPESNHAVWRRTSGRFTLSITPGTLARPDSHPADDGWVGVPYGTKARLILIHLQTEGLKARTVSLGPSLSAFLRSLGLPVTGGPRGSITAVREQALRIARCSFSLQWSDIDAASGVTKTMVSDTRIVDGLELWEGRGGNEWNGTVELSSRFHEHLREHAVPLDKRAIAHLSGNSLGLDLYALLAYRLPRLKQEVHLRWAALQSQIGSEESAMKELARRVRQVLPDVIVAYPHARIETTPTGLTLRPSQAAVPRLSIRGIKLVGS
ncbi:MAG: plasmid replication protein [Acetobacteraceae bacterium]|nr:plasmid replication protein [Acetobacteraceae bacterium]